MLLGQMAATAAELVLQKVPPLTVEQASRYPQNLARPEFGASIEALGHPAGAETKLPAGVSTVLISLPKIEQVESIAFSSAGAAGKFMVATSSAQLPPDSPQWHAFPTQDISGAASNLKIGPAEAKYVRLVFVLDRPGRISGFGVYGTPSVADFSAARPADGEAVKASHNLADLHAKSRALYVSSGADELTQAQNMIDDQPTTAFSFAADDRAPVVIIDLGRSVEVGKVTVSSPGTVGKADFFVFDTLPAASETADEPLHFNEEMLSRWKPVATASNDGSGQYRAEFAAKSGRYLLVRWSEIGDSALRVTEISALGRPTMLLVANAAAARRDGKDVSKDVKDFSKEGKDVPREGPEAAPPGEGPGPELPAPPPFVFTPVIVPTSP